MEHKLRLRTVASGALVTLLAAMSASDSRAQTVTFGSNAYEFVEVVDPYSGDNNSWFTARDAAEARVFNGVNGHLATITSSEENDFLVSLVAVTFPAFTGAWIGGKAPEGWLTGPESGDSFSFTAWGGIEPNNAGYAYMNVGNSTYPIGAWADDSAGQGFPSTPDDPVVGYFIEYEGAAVQAVPLLGPVGVGLLATSLALSGMIGVLRRRAPHRVRDTA